MPLLIAQVRLPYDSLIPTDVTVNTFSFDCPDTGNATLLEVADRLSKFYNETGTGGAQAIKDYLAGTIAGLLCSLKIYNRSEPEPRAPIYDELMPLQGGALNSIPAEVAICASFRGPIVSGVPAARRRGRIFIGPLALAAVNQQNSEPVRPTVDCRATIAQAMKKLMDKSNAVADWGVYSTVSATHHSVVHGWVDDAFDTMRSRGPKPTARTSVDRSNQLP